MNGPPFAVTPAHPLTSTNSQSGAVVQPTDALVTGGSSKLPFAIDWAWVPHATARHAANALPHMVLRSVLFIDAPCLGGNIIVGYTAIEQAGLDMRANCALWVVLAGCGGVRAS